jgi:hypothetical protein
MSTLKHGCKIRFNVLPKEQPEQEVMMKQRKYEEIPPIPCILEPTKTQKKVRTWYQNHEEKLKTQKSRGDVGPLSVVPPPPPVILAPREETS